MALQESPGTIRIATYEERRSLPYASPLALTISPKPNQTFPYVMAGIAMQTCNFEDAHSPAIPRGLAHHNALTQIAGNQYAIAQAPTRGIYTGVEEGF